MVLVRISPQPDKTESGLTFTADIIANYWNAACMFYLTGETERTVNYYQQAVDKGWVDHHQPHYHEYVYREEDSEQIGRVIAGQIPM
ncbi:hypothetical protein [Paenibacillus donghaensis]|uniref:Uncharacterized protein n=1 Tax=Paenibacillus donghaensis TaxID=414771 RepID=A0A2Z2KHN3_9BACL|nr:hypothetical protein [Paenibacillus donghaensis]ASA25764.1 hypothetical protein B9T62_36570 [Paenibacillus donghaensis]